MKDVDDDLEGNQGVDAGKGRETITSCIDEGLKVSEPSILTGGGAWQGIVARTAAERACRRRGGEPRSTLEAGLRCCGSCAIGEGTAVREAVAQEVGEGRQGSGDGGLGVTFTSNCQRGV